jgi:hypothetical protein
LLNNLESAGEGLVDKRREGYDLKYKLTDVESMAYSIDYKKRAVEYKDGQFGKACEKLGVQVIAANSDFSPCPQAKGRVERNHGVDQDRLVKELRLKGIWRPMNIWKKPTCLR